MGETKSEIVELGRVVGERSDTDKSLESQTDSDGPSSFVVPGTHQDDVDMRRLGRKQVLTVSLDVECDFDITNEHIYLRCDQRSFHALSILGLTSMIVDTWVGLLA